MSYISENIQKVKEEIEEARKRSLTGEPVELITVTKTFDVPIIEQAIDAGIKIIGENKVQELTSKIEQLNDKVIYHMIGNLQSNKVKYIYQDVALIHSLDRLSLAKEIEKRGKSTDDIVHCLVQVNIGKEKTKGGLYREEVLPFVEKMMEFPHIQIDGIMTVAPNIEDIKYLRSCFRNMVSLKEEIEREKFDRINMQYLSMGMSHDFEIAIEEGANMVRIGSKIFGNRDYSK